MLCPISKALIAQNYWQQEVDYLIQVSLDDSMNALHGHITMYYTNNSPNPLPFIYMHLMPNAYKGKKSALNNQLLAHDEQSLQFANTIYKGSIDSLDWKIEGTKVESKPCQDTVDIVMLEFPEALQPGQTVRIETPFYILLPSTHISRMGYKDHAYYLTQWYPKPAVYDAYGWHPMSYLDKGEFYSEFGNYEVQITVPKNFVVAASGDLITPEEIVALDTLANFSKTYVHPKKRKYLKKEIEPSSKNKTITYRINQVHDFAFCADPELLLLKDTMTLDGRPIVVQSFVKMSHLADWKESPKYIKEAIKFYSTELGPYPYKIFSVVDVDDITGGDMEYPMLAWVNNSYSIEASIVHEVGHNWLYGVLASNERDEHWMDEGLNTFYEQLFFLKKYPQEKIHFNAHLLDGSKLPNYQVSHYEYYSLARENRDQPVKTTSHLLSSENYDVLAYSKSSAYFWHLYKICGDTFDLAMKEYYNAWKFKHPMNEDMHEVFKKYIGDKSDWFFDQAMVTNEKINYEIKTIKKSGDEYIIEINNKGEIAIPIYVEVFDQDYKKLATYSFEPITGKGNITIPFSSDISWIALDKGMTIPDIDLANNYVKIKDGKKVGKPIRFNVLSSFENPYRKHINYLPGVSANLYDGLQVGIILHNYGFIPKKTEWFVQPMYSTLSARPSLYASITHTYILKKNSSDRLFFKTTFNMQDYDQSSGSPLMYFQLSPQLRFIFDRRDIYSPLTHEIGTKNQLLVTQVDPNLNLTSRWKFLMQNLIYYKVNYKKRLWDVQNTFTFEHAYDFGINYSIAPITQFTPALKLYNELKVSYIYFKGQSTIQLRVFAGAFLATPSMVTDTRFRLSGWNGPWDYAFNDFYMGRSESAGFFSQQTGHRDGDFKINSFVGQTNQWIITANLEWDVPMIYAGAFVDVGTYGGAGSFPGSQSFAYSIGLYLRTPDRTFQVYFPITYSSDIKNAVGLNATSYWETIRFTLQLQNIQIIKSIRKLFI